MSKEQGFNWLELRLLEHLSEHRHAVSVHELRGLSPGYEDSTVNMITELSEQDYVELSRLGDETLMVEITALGRHAYHTAIATKKASAV